MKAYEATKIGQNRGAPRIWLEGMKAKLAGFLPGKRFNIRKDESRKTLILDLCPTGFRVVSRKSKSGQEVPVIDINSAELLQLFDGLSTVRVIVQQARIVILPSHVELAKQERLARVKAQLQSGEPLTIGSLSHGGGVLSHALHSGLRDAGIPVRLAFANEIRAELLEHAHQANDCWDAFTVPLAAPMQHLAFDSWAMDHLPKVSILEAGIPCSGASTAGRGRNGAGHAEAHPEVGHLIVPLLAIVAKVQPAVICVENVPGYKNTGSMCILRNFLRDFGYVVHETQVDGHDWNSIENRSRLGVIAVTEGLQFSFADLRRPPRLEQPIDSILEHVDDDDERWSEMAGLKAKQTRDLLAGKGFKMQVVQGTDTSCPTLTKGYSKVRSTDPKLRHPSNPKLLRQFLPTEHAAMKQVPKRLISGLCATTAHEVLGQSICYEPFRAVGLCVGEMFATVRGMHLRPGTATGCL